MAIANNGDNGNLYTGYNWNSSTVLKPSNTNALNVTSFHYCSSTYYALPCLMFIDPANSTVGACHLWWNSTNL